MSIPIHKCIDRSIALRIGRYAIFLKIFVIPEINLDVFLMQQAIMS